MFLVACTVNLSAGSYAEKNLSVKKKNYIFDKAGNNGYKVLSASFGENKKEELNFRSDVMNKILEE